MKLSDLKELAKSGNPVDLSQDQLLPLASQVTFIDAVFGACAPALEKAQTWVKFALPEKEADVHVQNLRTVIDLIEKARKPCK
jgi:hypothetical protein